MRMKRVMIIIMMIEWSSMNFYNVANTSVKMQNSGAATLTSKWQRPPANWWTCNVDASKASNPPHVARTA
ncbi:hypothetical protein LguiB_030217 [Lonicera macranthoides]